MTEPRYEREDFVAGELVGAWGPDPNRRVWVVVDVGPPDSDRLIDLAAERGVGSAELARTLIHAALENIPPASAPSPQDPRSADASPSEPTRQTAPDGNAEIAAEVT